MSQPITRQQISLTLGHGSLAQGLSITLQLDTCPLETEKAWQAQLAPAPELLVAWQAWSQSYYEHFACWGTLHKSNEHAAVCEQAAATLLTQFNQWLRQPAIVPLREAWLEHCPNPADLQVLLQSQDPQLLQLPWHQWDLLERYPNAEVTLRGSQLDAQAQFSGAAAESSRRLSNQGDEVVQVLIVVGDRQTTHDIPAQFLSQDWPQKALKVRVETVIEPSLDEFHRKLHQHPWQILVMACPPWGDSTSTHGLNSNTSHPNTSHQLSATTLHRHLIHINPQEGLTSVELQAALSIAIAQGLQIILLNSHHDLAWAESFAPLELLQLIIWRESVSNRVTLSFCKDFLLAYANGMSVTQAVRRGREQLQALEGSFPCATWLPTLVQNRWAEDALPSFPVHPKLASKPQHGGLRNVAASLGMTALLWGMSHLGLLQPLERQAYDQLLQWRAQEPPESRLLLITTNTAAEGTPESSQDKPLPNSDLALSQLLPLLHQHQPAVLGLITDTDEVEQFLRAATGFSNAETPFITSCSNHSSDNHLSDRHSPGNHLPDSHLPGNHSPNGKLVPGSFLDSDLVLRRHPLISSGSEHNACTTPAEFGSQLALAYLERQPKSIQLEQLGPHHWQLGKAKFRTMGDRTFPQLLLNYRSHRSITQISPHISLEQVLAGALPEDRIRDRIILVGPIEPIEQQIQTPYGIQAPKLILQAQMISQLISAAMDDRPLISHLPAWGNGLWILSWASAGILLMLPSKWLLHAANAPADSSTQQQQGATAITLLLPGGALLLQGVCCWIALSQAGLVLPLIPGGLALCGGALVSRFANGSKH